MARIVVWGFTSNRTNEQVSKLKDLRTRHQVLSLQIDKVKDHSVLADCIVLIKHDATPEDQALNSVQWKVICSGGISKPTIDETKKIAAVPPDTLVDNLENFLLSTAAKQVVEKQDIEKLFSLDPMLEELLNPFRCANPLLISGGKGQEKVFGDAKVKLKEYVGGMLNSQGKRQ